MKLVDSRIGLLTVLLSDETDSLVSDHRLLHSRDGLAAADVEMYHHFRKDSHATQSNDRHRYCLIFHISLLCIPTGQMDPSSTALRKFQ